MTYCLAWKKDKSVFMIGDTAISSSSNKIISELNSFGEVQGLYEKYYVQEGKLKIYKVSDKLSISYSGDVGQAIEIIEMIYNMIDEMDIFDLMKVIETSFNTYDVEMIFVFSYKLNNYIYKFSNGIFKKCDYAEIGNGKDIPFFSDDIKSLVNKLYSDKLEKEYYLSMVISSIQCYVIKNQTFNKGVGGTITGIFLDNTLKWFRDNEYYIFDEDVRDAESISVIVRANSVFSASDVDGGIRYMLNTIKDNSMWNDLYLRKSIAKSLNTKNAFYYTFYSKKYNVAYFMKVNGYLHNIHFRRYVRRDKEKTYYAYMFRPDFTKYFIEFNSYEQRVPTLLEMEVLPVNYISHEESLKLCNKDDVIKRAEYEELDFDFSEMEYKDFDTSMLIPIKKIINEYHNIVLIDYHYFCDAIEEKINLYKPFRTFNISDLNLDRIINIFMKQLVEDDFDKYLFCAIKSTNYTKEILGCNIDDYFKQNHNFHIISTEKIRSDFNGLLFQIMKNFYINDSFFHLDKFIIISDDADSRSIMDMIIPKFNFSCNNPDILLVRNINGLTEMNGELRYIAIDYIIAAILGLSMDEFGQLESLAYDI